MSDEGKPLEPQHIFKRVMWRSMLSASGPAQYSIGWSITGIAAIAGLLISKLDTVSQAVSASGLRWGLILFAFALLFGVISRQAGLSVMNGLEMMAKIETLLQSSDGQHILGSMKAEPRRSIEELAKPFWWPISRYLHNCGVKGITDYLSSEKRLIGVFCFQVYTAVLHALCAAAAIIVIAFSIKG